jgi:hypothetical protein
MRVLLFSLFLITTSASAYQLVWQHEKNKELLEIEKKKPLYLSNFFGQRKYDKKKLGKVDSQFYQIGHQFFRHYRNYKKCLRVEFLPDRMIAKKIACQSLEYNMNYAGVRFQEVRDLKTIKDIQFSIEERLDVRALEAFNHQARDVLSDPGRISVYPFSDIEVSLDQRRSLVISKFALTISSELKQTRSAYTFLSKREIKKEQKLDFNPKRGDLIFRAGNRLLLYKRYQPHPFSTRLLERNHKHSSFLDSLGDHLFSVGESKRCFRDHLLYPNKFDCDQVLFKKQAFHQWGLFEMILVDLDNKTIMKVRQ